MSEQELIERTAKATIRERMARESLRAADAEARDARVELQDCWTILRGLQDEKVSVALAAEQLANVKTP